MNIVDDASLSLDIDHPEDLRHLPEDLRSPLGLDELVTSR